MFAYGVLSEKRGNIYKLSMPSYSASSESATRCKMVGLPKLVCSTVVVHLDCDRRRSRLKGDPLKRQLIEKTSRRKHARILQLQNVANIVGVRMYPCLTPLLTLLTLMAFSLYPMVGLVLLLYSFWSSATSWVTRVICWCHVLLGRPRRLVPGVARYITLRVTLFASLLSDMSKPTKTTTAVNLVDR